MDHATRSIVGGALAIGVTVSLVVWLSGDAIARGKPARAIAAPAAGGGRPGDAHRFATWTGYEVGRNPQAVTAADFNGDGAPDVAYGHLSFVHNTIAVQLNLGDGTMGNVASYPAQDQTNDIVASDLNGDGHVDLVAISEGLSERGNVIDVYLNRGAGTFQHTTASGGDGPTGLAVADLNGDGHPDLALANNSFGDQGTTVGVLLGNGNGTFRPEARYTAGPGVYGIAAADLNGDGHVDLVAARATSDELAYHITLFENTGAGAFAVAGEATVPGMPSRVPIQPVVSAADFDGDGRVDLAAGAKLDNKIAVLRNQGGFAFARTLHRASFGSTNLLARDLNGDGAPDLVQAAAFGGTQSTGEIAVLMNDGHGALDTLTHLNQGTQPTDVDAADFTGDGRPDLAVANEQSGTGSITPQLSNGRFAHAPVYRAARLLPFDSASADFNGDGHVDMALDEIDITSSGHDAVAIMTNDGNGRMAFTQTLPSGTDSNPKTIVAADLNGDGHPDLAWTPEVFVGNYQVAVALNKGNGAFGPVKLYPLQSCGTGHVSAIDVNDDGALDLVVANDRSGPSDFCMRVARTIRIALNNGNGTFQPDYGVELGSLNEMAAGGDFNGDGIVDLVVTDAITYVVFGTGNGQFGAATPYKSRGNEVAVGDFNGDGHPDAATSDGSLQSMWIMLNKGNGTFGLTDHPGEKIFGYLTGNAVSLGDVDGDGHTDVAVSDAQGQDVGVFYGRGDGTFRSEIRYGAEYDLVDVTLADYDGDGRPDIGGPAGIGGAFSGRTGVTTVINLTS
jgi:hypothetical protein